MYHKVFINNVELAFANEPIDGYTPLPGLPENHDLETWIATLRLMPECIRFTVQDSDGEQWQSFASRHVLVVAAGGLVTNATNELLVMKRLGWWDLPKGKMDAGETPAQCALREVEEECGIENLQLGKELPPTYHTYAYKGQNVLKKTHWFSMAYLGSKVPTPQTEEDITEVRFMPAEEVSQLVTGTYPSLRPLFDTYLVGNK